MPNQADIRQVFLKKFVEEILINTKRLSEEKQAKFNEENRIREIRNLEKIKTKFQVYVKKPNPNLNQNNFQQTKVEFIKQAQKTEPKLERSVFIPNIERVSNPENSKRFQNNNLSIPKKVNTNIKLISKTQLVEDNKKESNNFEEISLSKINPLINDNLITYIECLGENKEILIKRLGNIIKTNIKLNDSEIKNIINYFSFKTKIPMLGQVFNARIDNLEIISALSKDAKPSFIIKKDIIPKL